MDSALNLTPSNWTPVIFCPRNWNRPAVAATASAVAFVAAVCALEAVPGATLGGGGGAGETCRRARLPRCLGNSLGALHVAGGGRADGLRALRPCTRSGDRGDDQRANGTLRQLSAG